MKWLTAALLAVAAVLAGLLVFRQFSPPELGGDAPDAPVPLPALQLVNDKGQIEALNRADGRVRLVFFGYTRCPDVCPATLTNLKTTFAALPDDLKRQIQVQFVTVDPEHDTPNVMRDYLGRFDPAFTGLTGKAESIDEAARQMFVGNVKPLPTDAHEGHGDEHTSDDVQPDGAQVAARIHGDQVSVVDGSGQLVRIYGNDAVIGGTLERDLPGLVQAYAGASKGN